MGHSYVRIYFHRAGAQRPAWYWAIKLNEVTFKRVHADGDTEMSSRMTPAGEVVTEELLVGRPIKVMPARMNLKYGELEVDHA